MPILLFLNFYDKENIYLVTTKPWSTVELTKNRTGSLEVLELKFSMKGWLNIGYIVISSTDFSFWFDPNNEVIMKNFFYLKYVDLH